MPDPAGGSLLCLDCQAPLTASRWIAHIAICNGCGAMMALEDGKLVKGTGKHVDQLTPADLKEAQTHRGQFRRRPRR